MRTAVRSNAVLFQATAPWLGIAAALFLTGCIPTIVGGMQGRRPLYYWVQNQSEETVLFRWSCSDKSAFAELQIAPHDSVLAVLPGRIDHMQRHTDRTCFSGPQESLFEIRYLPSGKTKMWSGAELHGPLAGGSMPARHGRWDFEKQTYRFVVTSDDLVWILDAPDLDPVTPALH